MSTLSQYLLQFVEISAQVRPTEGRLASQKFYLDRRLILSGRSYRSCSSPGQWYIPDSINDLLSTVVCQVAKVDNACLINEQDVFLHQWG